MKIAASIFNYFFLSCCSVGSYGIRRDNRDNRERERGRDIEIDRDGARIPRKQRCDEN